ncbi:MAG: Rrf2 family transcriptional regulator [Flavobacteriales bacterium]|jgi:Rrf2 family protein|nr:Rrf2 family transcriptional regulator [Flavobacteriales bacterium]
MFSKSCEYGLRAVLFIASESQAHRRASLVSIAREIDSPAPFTAKILQILVRNKVVRSEKGAAGGFFVHEEDLPKITIEDVVKAIDGEATYKECVLGMKQCSEKHPCPVHHKFKPIKDSLLEMLSKTTLRDTSDSLNAGLSFLKNN